MGWRDRRKLKRRIGQLAGDLEGDRAPAARRELADRRRMLRPFDVEPADAAGMVRASVGRVLRTSPEVRVRRAALEVLEVWGCVDPDVLLAVVVGDEDDALRLTALKALTEDGWSDGDVLLRLATEDPDGDVRRLALQHLLGAGWVDEATLLGMLDDRDGRVRAMSLAALVELDPAYVDRCVPVIREDVGTPFDDAVRLVEEHGGHEHVPELRDAIRRCRPGGELRTASCVHAVQAIASLGGPGARAALSEVVCSPVPEVREVAAGLLEGLGGPEEAVVVAVLTGGAGDRRAAARLLASTGGGAAVEPLSTALSEDPDLWVRAACAGSLGKLGGQRAVAALGSAARDDEHQVVRRTALEALAALETPAALDVFVAAIADDDHLVRAKALAGIAALGDRSVLPTVRDALPGSPGWSGDVCLAALGDVEATVRVLDELYAAPSHQRRVTAALFGDYDLAVSGIPHYTQTKRGVDAYVHSTSGSQRAVDWLCEVDTPASSNVLHHAAQLPDAEVVAHLVEVPYSHSAPSGVEEVTRTLSFESVRAAATAALRERGDPPYDASVYADPGCWTLGPDAPAPGEAKAQGEAGT